MRVLVALLILTALAVAANEVRNRRCVTGATHHHWPKGWTPYAPLRPDCSRLPF